MKFRGLSTRKRTIVYAVFVALIVALLGNEWVWILRTSVEVVPPPSPSDQKDATLFSLQHFVSGPGKFNLLNNPPYHYRQGRPRSWVHCVGENFLRNAWVWKSCAFEYLCYDEGNITLYPARPSHLNVTKLSVYARSSTDPWTQQVSSSVTRHGWIASQRYQWFPDIVETFDGDGFYELPVSIVWIPMSVDPSFLEHPSSIIFDILLPLYTLTTLFGWENQPILWTPLETASTCLENPDTCYPTILQPYLKLLNLAPSIEYIPRFCARRAAAGVGTLSDHGTKRHGDRPADYQKSHNVGKGGLLYAFRQYCLHNMQITHAKLSEERTTTRIIAWATSITTDLAEDVSFQTQSTFLAQQHTLSKRIRSEHIVLSHVSLQQQLSMAVSSSFWIARVGEDCVPAFFMPRGGTLIVYYDDENNGGGRPTMLHWDLWNHASHLTVHWLPKSNMMTEEGLQLLRRIVELQVSYLDGVSSESTGKSGIVPKVSALGYDLQWNTQGGDFVSSSHCLGDNFVAAQASSYRSCIYRHLCLDVTRGQFQLELSSTQANLQKQLAASSHGFQVVATDLNQTVMHGQNVRFDQSRPWAPVIVDPESRGYFSLPRDVLWVPYTLDASFAGNVGHFCWDFLLPFYTLLAMYGLERNESIRRKLVLTSTDDDCRNTPKCAGLTSKFMPLMGIDDIYSVEYLKLTVDGGGGGGDDDTVSRICSSYSAAGIGMLTDHGSTRHGQSLVDYQQVHNSGKGAHLYAFRNFMLRNLGIDETLLPKRSRQGVLFSVNSSNNKSRRKSFQKQIAAAHRGLSDVALVSGAELAHLPLRDQVEIIMQLSVFVSTVGGSAATCMFLPRHASLILYFASEEDFVSRTRQKDFPTMMDFDFWNNASYLRVHWLPIGSMDEEFHLNLLVDLIRSELAQTKRLQATES